MWPNIKQLIDSGALRCSVLSGDSDSLYRMVCKASVIDYAVALPTNCSNELLFLSEAPVPKDEGFKAAVRYAAGIVVPSGMTHEPALFQLNIPIYTCPPEEMNNMASACNEQILRQITLYLSGELPPEGYQGYSSLYFSSVFENAINGMRYSDSAMDSVSHSARMFPPSPYILALIRIEDGADPADAAVRSVLSALNELMLHRNQGSRLPISVRGNYIVLLMPASGADAVAQDAAARSFIMELRASCEVKFSVCFSESFPNINYIYTNYRSVMFSLALYTEMYGEGCTISFNETSMYLYLLKRMDFPGTTFIYDKYWGQLKEYDIANKTELSLTLDAFVRMNGKSVETAEHLGVHRNTMRNRLHFIGKLLNVDISNPETIFQLSLAQKLKSIMKAAMESGISPAGAAAENAPQERYDLPLSKEIVAAYDLLSRHDASGETVARYLMDHGVEHVTVRRVGTGSAYSDFLRIVIPGLTGRARGMSSPTLGVAGRLGGIKLENQPLSLISDADGAIVAIALALKLASLCATKTGPLGDVIITTQIALSSSSRAHKPAALALSAVDIKTACAYEYDENMDALLSITVCRATRWVNTDGIAVTPTVMGGLILPPSEDLLSILETVSSRSAVVFPITNYDLTPDGNGLYHINSIMQHSLIADCPVVGVALTSSGLVPGVTLRHNDLSDAELAMQFALEVAFGFTAGNVTLYDKDEFALAKESKLKGRESNPGLTTRPPIA
ncbi:MAG: DUF1177 family protein [Clostridia bacterium]|nr:DUF1177 family protein [Clostridia bacterium]